MLVDGAVLDEAIATYNQYRCPMATASVIANGVGAFRVRFEGPFCRMCCDYDYFEDLLYELDEYGVDIQPLTITAIERVGREAFVVEFAIAPKP